MISPCLSKLSSLNMHTKAKYLLTSRKYKIVALFSLITELDCVSNALFSASSVPLKDSVNSNVNSISYRQ